MSTLAGTAMSASKGIARVGCCLLASSLRLCAAVEAEDAVTPSAAADAWIAPLHGQPANDVERLGSRDLAEVGFARANEVLYLEDSRWLVAGRTVSNEKELRLFDAENGTSTRLYSFGGELDDIPSFALMAAPFESNGMRPIAILAMSNFGGRCCVDNRVDLLMALLGKDGKLHSARKVVAAKTQYFIQRYSRKIGGPTPYDESEIVQEGRLFFLRSEAPSGPAFVLWQKSCQGNDQPLGDDDAPDASGPCGQGMDLVRESSSRFSIDPDGPSIQSARTVDDAARPPPLFWRTLPYGNWTNHEIGVSDR